MGVHKCKEIKGMETSHIIDIVLSILTVIMIFVGYYFYIKAKLHKAATEAINDAEQTEKDGEEKLKDAVEQVYALVPVILKPIFNKELLTYMIQDAFDKIEAYAKKQQNKKSDDDK